MSVVIVSGERYTVDSLYQWDSNQVLEIRGLSLPSVPEIHFTNGAMDRAIVRQATMDAAGIIRAEVPNSLLQTPYKIVVYVCLYEGDSFKSKYKIEIPVNKRNKPGDYKFEDTAGEIYSYNALENKLENTLKTSVENYDAAKKAYDEAAAEYVEASKAIESIPEKVAAAENAATQAEEAKVAAENAVAAAEAMVIKSGNFTEVTEDGTVNLLTEGTIHEEAGDVYVVNGANSVDEYISFGFPVKEGSLVVTTDPVSEINNIQWEVVGEGVHVTGAVTQTTKIKFNYLTAETTTLLKKLNGLENHSATDYWHDETEMISEPGFYALLLSTGSGELYFSYIYTDLSDTFYATPIVHKESEEMVYIRLSISSEGEILYDIVDNSGMFDQPSTSWKRLF